MDSVWAPLPSVSDSARHSAITAISNAILRFSCEASLAWSACSMLSCALMILSLPEKVTIAEQIRRRKGLTHVLWGESLKLSGARMRGLIDLQQPFAVDAGINLRGRQRS